MSDAVKTAMMAKLVGIEKKLAALEEGGGAAAAPPETDAPLTKSLSALARAIGEIHTIVSQGNSPLPIDVLRDPAFESFLENYPPKAANPDGPRHADVVYQEAVNWENELLIERIDQLERDMADPDVPPLKRVRARFLLPSLHKAKTMKKEAAKGP